MSATVHKTDVFLTPRSDESKSVFMRVSDLPIGWGFSDTALTDLCLVFPVVREVLW